MSSSVRTRSPVSDRHPSPVEAAQSVKLVFVGLHGAALETFQAAVDHDATFDATSAPDLASARTMLDATDATPTILVTESSLLRKRLAFPSHVHVMAIAGPDRNAERDAGADDVVRRPLHLEDIRIRLRLAARSLTRRSQTPRDVLRDAMRSGRSGEVVVSSGESSARVHVEEGRIAWVHRAGHAVSVRALVARCGVDLDDAAARDVVEESRASRKYFGDILIEWEIVDRIAFERALKQVLEEELVALLAWDDATATFVSNQRPPSSSIAFTEAELRFPDPPSVRIATQPDMPAVRIADAADPAAVQAWLTRMSAIPNIASCILLDERHGIVLGSSGFVEATMNVAWELAGAFSALGPESEELLASTKSFAYLVRSARPTIPAIAIVGFEVSLLSPAMARILVSKAGRTNP